MRGSKFKQIERRFFTDVTRITQIIKFDLRFVI
jgi:hypothetical protein